MVRVALYFVDNALNAMYIHGITYLELINQKSILCESLYYIVMFYVNEFMLFKSCTYKDYIVFKRCIKYN